MTLITSISGIRGTIGGKVGYNLTPIDIVSFVSAYAVVLSEKHQRPLKIVVGRDARVSGKMVEGFVVNTLISYGVHVINLELSTTPTVELAVTESSADGGIIITASHNPSQWNALKLLNHNGEIIASDIGEQIVKLALERNFTYSPVEKLGKVTLDKTYLNRHIEMVMQLKLTLASSIKNAKLKVVLDAVNSTGGIVIPKLLDRLGVEVVPLFCEPNGIFPHDPEPLDKNLSAIKSKVVEEKADLGIVVDPDVDRLLFVCEDGTLFGEEYTVVACADYVLMSRPGNTVTNLSSTRALRDVTERYGFNCYYTAVGELNVVQKMKAVNAVIGGEGNGGVIYPELHYGRDALVGIVLFLSLLCSKKCSAKTLKLQYPQYYMSKSKIDLNPKVSTATLLSKLEEVYKKEKTSTIDGLKIDFKDAWVHVRPSNTEPIIRLYAEAKSQAEADELATSFLKVIRSISDAESSL